MASSPASRKRLPGRIVRSTAPARTLDGGRPARTRGYDVRPGLQGLWPGILLGLASIALFVVLGAILGAFLSGCTIQELTMYKTVYPIVQATPMNRIGPS